jgi:hypothetical protein
MAKLTRTSTNIPASPACGQWETLLADALDGVLRPEDEAFFASHKDECPSCAVLYEEARRGREWLDFLSLEPEVPAGLMDKILAATGPDQAAGFGILPGQLQPATVAGVATLQPWQRPGFTGRGFMGTIRRFAEPRLMMTAAMAFFSIALTLNLTGVKLKDLRVSDLRPQAVRSYMERQVAFVSTPIVRYYDHLRLVYEVQTRMKELRRSTQGDGQQPTAPNGNGSGESQQKKDGGSRLDRGVDPPEQSVAPADLNSLEAGDVLDTSFQLNGMLRNSEGSAVDVVRTTGVRTARGRSTEWIA